MKTPSNPKIKTIEISLNIETGNIICQRFDNVDDALEFIKLHVENPDAILEKINPRNRRVTPKLPFGNVD